MREVLGAGRGVQAGEVETPAMAAEARRERRQGVQYVLEGEGEVEQLLVQRFLRLLRYRARLLGGRAASFLAAGGALRHELWRGGRQESVEMQVGNL